VERRLSAVERSSFSGAIMISFLFPEYPGHDVGCGGYHPAAGQNTNNVVLSMPEDSSFT
jgi:hypothetical protein